MSDKEKLTLGGILYDIGCAILSMAAIIFVCTAAAIEKVWNAISKLFNKNKEE